jgi:uncharacterized repeat protein (TIGR01451 family)
MTVTSDDAINNITANAPTYTATSGVTASLVSGPTLISTDNNISGAGDPVIYEWIYSVVPGTDVGKITFKVSSVLDGNPGADADANSVIVAPELTWQSAIGSAPPLVIYNTAILNDLGGNIENSSSNITETEVSCIIAIDEITVDNITCFGAEDGRIILTVLGAVGTVTVTWEGPGPYTGTGDEITDLAPGTYTATVTDSRGCVVTATATVTQPAVLAVTASKTDVVCFGQSNGSITAFASGGTPPYEYRLDDGVYGSTNSFPGLATGTYTLWVQDKNLCTASTTFTISEPDPIAVEESITPATCFSDAAISLTVSGGTPPYTYDWHDLPGTSNPRNRAGLGVVTDTFFTVTITDSKGCTFDASFEILAPLGCEGVEVCQSDAARVFTVDPDPDVLTYVWSIKDFAEPPNFYNTAIVSPVDGIGSLPEVIIDWTNVPVGEYKLCVITHNTCGSSNEFCIPIFVIAAEAFADADPVCEGGDLQLFASGGVSYLWSGPNNFSSSSANPVIFDASWATHSGVYTVDVTNSDGCVATASVTVTVSSPPVVTAENLDNAACGQALGSIDLSVEPEMGNYSYLWSTGATTQDIENLPSGNYTVVVTDLDTGCITEATFSIIDLPGPVGTATATMVSCFGDNDGSATFTITEGVAPPFTYSWSNGITLTTANLSHTISGLTAGKYDVVVTDYNDCITAASVIVTQPNPLNLDYTKVNVACFGEATGSINLLVSGGTPTYSYIWTGPTAIGSIPNPTGLLAGTYDVTVTDDNGCVETATIIITQPAAALAATETVTAVKCFGGTNGQITLSVTGGTAPYTYSWTGPGSFTATTRNISGLEAGLYSVTITDAKGCTEEISAIEVDEPDAALAISGVETHVSCFDGNDGNIILTVEGGTATYTYSWSNGATTKDLENISAGTYTVLVTDANGCTATNTFTINQPTLLTASAVPTAVTCYGLANGSIALTVGGGTTAYTYQWTTTNGIIPVGQVTVQNPTGLTAGTYNVTVTDANGCTIQASAVVTQPTKILVSGAVTNLNCFGDDDGQISLNVSGGTPGESPEPAYTYSWSHDAALNSPTASGLTVGTYTATVTDVNGCSTQASYTITSPTEIQLSAVASDISCFGGADGSINLTVSGGVAPYTYLWTTGDGIIPPGQASVEDPVGLTVGTYTVTVTDANGCTAETSATVTEPILLILDVTLVSDVTCLGGNDGSATATPAGGTAPYTYLWSNGSTAQSPTNFQAGVYNVTVTDARGCTATGTITIAQPETEIELFANVRNTSWCEDNTGEIELIIVNGVEPFTFLWTTTDGSIPSGQETQQNPVGLASGTYTVKVTDADGCEATLSVSVGTAPALLVSIDAFEQVCAQDEDGNLIDNPANGEVYAVVQGGVTPYSFSWSASNGGQVPVGQVTNTFLIGLVSGTYTVTITDADGCTAEATITLEKPTCAPPQAFDDFATTCGGVITGSVATNDEAVVAGAEFLPLTLPDPAQGILEFGYYDEDLDKFIFDGSYTFTPTFSYNGVVTMTYKVENPDGLADEATLTIYVSQMTAEVTAANTSHVECGASDGEATVTHTGGFEPYTYFWNTDPVQTTYTATGLAAGTYTVTVTDDKGCTVTATVTLYNACLELTKTITGGDPYNAAGDEIYYSFAIKNTGNVDLPGPFTILDDKITEPIICDDGPLAPDATLTCTGIYAVTSADLTAGSVTNKATATTIFNNQTFTSNEDQATAQAGAADVGVEKTVDTPTPNVGTDVTFTIVVTNYGPAPARDVQVSDQLPNGYTYVSHTTSVGTYSFDDPYVWDIGDLALNGTATLTITTTVNEPGPGVSYLNTATITESDQYDPTPGNNTDSQDVTPQQADLAITKTVDNATPNVGDNVTFTITVSNNGPDAATGVVVTDMLPAGLTYVSSVPSQGTYTAGTGVWETLSIANAGTATLEITATVTEAILPGATNTATITESDQYDPTPGNNTDSQDVTPQQADLAITKTVDNATPNVGDNVTFTITVSNNGPDAATGVVVTDMLPAGLTYVSSVPSQGTYTAGTGVWETLSIANAGTATLEITATVTEAILPGATNTATITESDQYDPTPGNNTDSQDVTPQQADLAITKTVDNATPNVGDNVTFTITVSNNGPDAATGVVVTDMLPAGLTYVSSVPSQGTYTAGTGVWETLSIANAGTATLEITATVTEAILPGATNTATITESDQYDPTPGNNTDSQDVTPQQADLAITKTVDNATPNVGDNVTFTITVSNNGPDAATGVVVTDMLPAGLTYVSSVPSQGTYTAGTGVWETLSIANAGTATLEITATVTEAILPGATNTATITESDQYDPTPGNNTDSQDVTPQQADLAITKTVDNATPNVGDNVTFTITVSNNGPDAATGVVVTDMLPAGLTYVSSVPSQGTYTAGTGVWETLSIANAGTATLEITATVTEAILPGATNTATITESDQYDPTPGNNTDSQDVTPQQADLAITKTVDNATPNVGDNVTFTITVSNNGPDAATGVVVTDMLPAGLTYVSSVPSQGTYTAGTGVWETLSIANAGTATLEITATVTEAILPGATNTATITESDQYDPTPGNNTDSQDVTPQQADLAITKTVDNATPNVGDNVTFTITVSNNGPDAATGVVVTDMLPAGLTYVSSVPSQGTYTAGTGVWETLSIANAGTATLEITATVTEAILPGATNTATITESDQYDPTPGNNTDSQDVTPQQADLAITKTVDNATPNVGDNVTFTITVSNNGPDAATGVVVTDMLPAGLTYVSSVPSQGTYTAGTGVWETLSIANAGTATLEITATVTEAILPGATNTATITESDQYDPTPGNNTDSQDVTPQQADLAITKTVDNATPNVGDNVTFTITVSNNGPDAATGVVVTDMLPAGLTYVSSVPSQGTYTAGTGVWETLSIANAGTATLEITATVTEAILPGATNTATITESDQYDPTPGNNTDSQDVTPQQADLAITKTVDNATPNVGDNVTFTITVSNNGPDAATGVVVTDMLPAGLTYVSSVPSQGTYTAGTGVWETLSIANAGTATLEITATVTEAILPGATNTATITESDQYDPTPGNNTDSQDVTPQQADLAITKTVDNATPNVGDNVTFTITVSNNGPDAATGVVVTDMLPAGLTYVSSVPSQGTYTAGTGVWETLSIANAGTATLEITATVTEAILPGATNTATITESDQYDPTPGNNTDSQDVTPQQADLAITKTVDNATPNVGDNVTFTITVSNNGPDAATGVVVTDMLPAGLTYVSSVPSQGTYTAGTGVWETLSIANAGTATLEITATVTEAILPGATNTATITESDQYDPTPGNNTDSQDVTPQQADLAITKTVDNATPNVGDNVTFTITVSNNGPDAATGVVVTDMLPAGLTYVSSVPSQGTYTAGTGVWETLSIANAGTATLEITATVTEAILPGATNTATITESDQYDPTPGNNTDSQDVTPQQADLAITKTVDNATPNVGDNVTFTITVSNNGPDAATGVVVTDMLPAGLTYVSSVPSQGTYTAGTGVWETLSIANAGTATLEITATVTEAILPGATNTATITESDQYDPTPGNNTDSQDVTPQQADLAITKTVDNATPNVGDNVTFTITVSNNGPDAATGVVVTDMLPAGLTYVSSVPSQGTYTAGTGVWETLSIANAGTATLEITATVTEAILPGATNTATITESDQYDPTPGNNTDSQDVTPQQADLAITKTVDNATPNVGDNVTFTITVSNNGPDAATGVVVTDMLPAGLTYVSSVPSQGTYTAGTGVWETLSIANAGTATLEITATVTEAILPGATNTATITESDQYDPTPGNNTDSQDVTPQQADLAITKTVDNATPNVGDNVTFTITVSNNGPDAATGVVVTDMLPAGLTYVSSVPSQGTYTAGTGVWETLSIANAGTATLEITATVTEAILPGATNTATITESDQYDPTPGNNTDSQDVTPQQADLAITKTVDNATPNVGDNVTFTITVSNNGPDAATGVVVTDMLPAGLTYVSSVPSQGTYTAGTGVWETLSIANAGTATLEITATVTEAILPGATNTATITESDQYDPTPGNNTDSQDVTPQQADLAITKTVDNATPNVGDNVTFTITVSNNGPDAATGVVVTDMLPAGLTYVSSVPSQGTYTAGTGVWETLSIANAGTATLEITATVTEAILPGATNTATITESDQYDPTPGNNTDSQDVTPQQADLAITKTVDNATPNVGDNVTFTITVSNNGPDAATGVVVTDMLPAGLTYVSSVPSQGTYTAGTGVWETLSIANAGTATLEITATVTEAILPGATNTATITESDQYDPTPGNNTDSQDVTPQQADLAITKTVDNATPNVGDNVTFTITVSNNGPDAATGVVVTDMLPAGLTYVSSVPSQGTYTAGTGVWETLSIANAGTATLEITATVTEAILPGATNTATITESDQYDPTPGNNTDSQDVTPQQADLAITKTVDNATPNVGDNVTFTITVSNNGPDAATGVVVTDMLPAGLTYVSSVPSQGTYTAGTGVWETLSIANAGTATLEITATVTEAILPGATNTATITESDQYDPTPGNNTDSQDVTPQQADLAITKTVDNATPNVGDNVTFTITVSNNGPDAATGVVVTDMLPAGLTYVSSVPSQGTYTAGTGVWETLSIANAGTATLEITATVTEAILPGATNTATITESDQYDPTPGNNTDSQDVTPQQADLAITKTVDNATPNVGDNVTFTITVTNNGPDAATGVEVTDQLPTGLTYVSDNGAGAYINGTGVWTVGTIAFPGTTTLEITVLVTENALPSADNIAAITASDQFDPENDNNEDNQLVTPVALPSIAVVKTASSSTYALGDPITYTFTVTNTGNVTMSDVEVGDPLFNLTFGPITALSPNASQTFTYVYTVTHADMMAGVVENIAVATGTFNGDDYTASDQEDITAIRADLSITKTDQPDPVIAGNLLTYTITVNNLGPNTAENVQIFDDVPASIVSPVYSTDDFDTSQPWVSPLIIGNLASGGSYTFRIRGTVTADTPVGSVISNTATVDSDTFDHVPDNNSSTAITDVNTSADLVMVKTVSSDPVIAGTTITYTLTITNDGPSDAQNVVVTDVVPSQIQSPQFSLDNGLTWTPWVDPFNYANGKLEAGDSFEMLIQGIINPATADGTTITNTATVSSSTPDPELDNNTDEIPTLIERVADLSIVKTQVDATNWNNLVEIDQPVITPGTSIYYLLTVENFGPSYSAGVVIEDILPVGISSPVFALYPSVSIFDWTGTREIPEFNFPGSNQILIRGFVDPDFTGTLTNTATITSTLTHDPVLTNNTSEIVTQAQPLADLSITKEVIGGTVSKTETITYRLRVNNSGPSTATDIEVEDIIHPEIDNVQYALGSPVGWASWTGSVNVGSLEPDGPTITLYIRGTVLDMSPSENTNPIPNTATVTSTVDDPNLANNTVTIFTPLNAEADLALTKDGPLEIVAGTTITYTITVTNNSGTFASEGVFVEDLINPAKITNAEYSFDQNDWNLWTNSLSLGTVSPTQTVTFYIRGKVVSDILANQIINVAEVFSSTPDPDNSNDIGTVTTTIKREADLEVIKIQIDPDKLPLDLLNLPPYDQLVETYSVDPLEIMAGETIYYALLFKNYGPSEATNVVISDAVPGVITNVMATRCQFAPNPWPGQTPPFTLPVGDFCIVLITGEVLSDAAGVITNTATIASADVDDPNPENDSSTIETQIVGNADLRIVKTSSPNPVLAGEEITYTLTVNNFGPSDALDVRVNDIVPAAVLDPEFTLDGGSSWNPWIGQYNYGTLANGASFSFQIRGTVNPNTPQSTQIVNVATVTSTLTPDPNPNNNTSIATNSVNRVADLMITKLANPEPVVPGQTLTYTVSVTNLGPSSAIDAIVTDVLPAGLSNISASTTYGTWNAPTWTMGIFAVGATETLTITAIADELANGTTITNTAVVLSNTFDPDTDNNTSTVTSTITATPHISLSKTADKTAGVAVDETITYTYVVTNTGDVAMNNVTLVDNHSGTGTLSAFDPVPPIATLAVGASVTFTATYVVTQADIDAQIDIVNTATATATFAGEDYSSSDGETVTLQVASPSIAIVKTGTLDMTVVLPFDRADAGDIVNYTFRVENTGNVTLYNVVVSDLNTSVTLNSPHIGTMAPGAVITLTGTYTLTQADIDAGVFSNTATVSGDDPEGDPINEDDDDIQGLDQMPSIAVSKTANPGTYAVIGQTITYTIIVENTGNVTLSNIQVNDPLTGLATTVLTLSPDDEVVYTETYIITHDDLLAGSVTNTVTAAGNDPNDDPVEDDDEVVIGAVFNDIFANDDTAGPINGLTGGDAGINVLDNDELNGVAVDPNDVTITSTPTAELTVNADGTVSVTPGTPAGTYTISYTICEDLNPTNCDDAVVTVTVEEALIVANDDTAGPINGLTGGDAGINVLDNDELNGTAVDPNDVTITSTPTAELTVNADGTVSVTPGTPAGTYTISYTICEDLNPTNCDDAVVTVTVEEALIVANDDTYGPVNGLCWQCRTLAMLIRQ